MPKIIKDLENKIFNSAIDLFGEYGYKKVDMKLIAKKVGIAVGTLYNYYPNKKELYIDVFKKSWQETFYKLDSIINEKSDIKEKIRKYIDTLYNEILRRKGLGGELIKENVFRDDEKDELLYVKRDLLKKIEGLIKEVKEDIGLKLEDGMESRLAETIFILILKIMLEHPDEKEKNIKFIIELIECTYGK
ncbi:TetR/AcrR family transcriptional regulator [Tepidibacter thalassicus]|uniref:Transcriptional regulator, TetR family n=1 Tax=Tepidibacter thalassicus DSM 15285 TaxID=1123350 RepID=A0A1M5QT49_9FIRM|nr:TetR/AcrR family transcriptional regulator [Tepidibacter thalassicus]SHH17304.1 transcriptional regulator, TetR family [Tepidibacter thalassicus DSM 15285]